MKTMDTQRREVADGGSVDSASKKLRQALLPFQVISPVGVSSKKRKIIDDVDAKVSKNSRIEKQSPEIIDISEAKENVNLEVQKSETSIPPIKEKSLDDEDEEVLCLNLDSSGNECAESADNAGEEAPMEEGSKDTALESTKEEEGSSSEGGNKSIEIESESELDKTGENANSSINVGDVSIGDSDVKGNLSASDETSEINASAVSCTPKALQKKKLLSLKKREQREKVRQELERKKEEIRKEKEDRLLQKKKEKEEKKEEFQRRLSQKLEEKQKREEERNEKRKQKEEERLKKEEEKVKKEEEKVKEKQRKEEEKQRKEEERVKEKLKKEEEKKKLEEEEEHKKKKAAAAFVSFFVPKKSNKEEEQVTVEAFMPFRVKGDMRLAPVVRRILTKEVKAEVESEIAEQSGKKLYLAELKERTPLSHPETWPSSEIKDDVVILEDEDDDVPTSEDRLVLDPHHDEQFRAKLLQFCENKRPPYWGTWRKKSSKVGPRRPFYRDEKYFDYEVDSDDEWEEEEPGESLHGSDDEKESEDEYEVDNEFFVPHGYLSNEEAAAEEADDEVMSPETQKAKLKLLGLEFEEEMKQKTKQIKPQLIGCYWINETMDEHLSHQYKKIFSQYKAVASSETIPTSFTTVPNTPSSSALGGNQAEATAISSVGRKKTVFPEEAMPDLIKLLHANRHGLNFLALEFYAHLSKGNGESEEERIAGESPQASKSRISKRSIAEKIREIATWKLCTDEGPIYGKNYWFVSESVRAQYNLSDLPQTIHWKYNLKPKMRGKVKAEASNVEGSPSSKLAEVGDESSPTQPKKPHLITKFTKVISKEERLKQLAQSNVGVTPSKANESIPVGKPSPVLSGKKPSPGRSSIKCGSKPEKTTPVISGEPKVKKRVPLLVSVPRGQEIPKNYSLPSFLKKSPAATSEDDKKSTNSSDITKVAAKEKPDVVTLD